MQKLFRKYWLIWDVGVWNFGEALTNDVVSFEQPGPGFPEAILNENN